MRWFKHMTQSHDDEVLSELMDEFGAEGYGVWWLILEKIGQSMDETERCFARYSVKVWANSCRVSTKKFQNIVRFLEKHGVFSLNFEQNYLTIECCNLLKYRDEYSKKKIKKSGENPDNVPTNSGQTPAQDTETDTEADTEKNVVDDASARTIKDWQLFFIEKYGFNHSVFLNANVIKLCSLLVTEHVSVQEMQDIITNVNATQRTDAKRITSPSYYTGMVLNLIEAKKNPIEQGASKTQSGLTTKGGNYAEGKRIRQQEHTAISAELQDDEFWRKLEQEEQRTGES
jgi:hypothetical protein